MAASVRSWLPEPTGGVQGALLLASLDAIESDAFWLELELAEALGDLDELQRALRRHRLLLPGAS